MTVRLRLRRPEAVAAVVPSPVSAAVVPVVPSPESLSVHERPPSMLVGSRWPLVVAALGIAVGVTIFLIRADLSLWLLERVPALARLD